DSAWYRGAGEGTSASRGPGPRRRTRSRGVRARPAGHGRVAPPEDRGGLREGAPSGGGWRRAMIGYLLGALAIVFFGLYARFRPGWRKTGPYFPDSFVAGLALFAIGGAVNAVQM